jgi:redox-sensitive bicupin YhaK (pirin superfamily)
LKAAVRTHSPLFYQHWEMDAGERRAVTATYGERAVYCASREIEVGGTLLRPGQMAVLSGRDKVDLAAREASTVMALGGDPIGERFLLWNFVSSSKERLEQAAEDWRQQRTKLPDGDNLEFTPMPEKQG